MQVLSYIAVILLTALIVIFGMTTYQMYLQQSATIIGYERQMVQMAQACNMQIVPQSGPVY